MATPTLPDTTPWITPRTEADHALLAPRFVKRIPARPAAAAMLALALMSGAAQAQPGYWTDGNTSIYGGRGGSAFPQYHDTSNSGPIYAPPSYGYQQPSTRFSTTCVQYGIQTVCN